MADPATTTTAAATVTPYLTTIAAVAAPTIAALGLNYATQNKRAERIKALIDNKVALTEQGAADQTTKEIQVKLDDLILLTLQTDINKSTKLTRKQLAQRIGIAVAFIAFSALVVVASLHDDFFTSAQRRASANVIAAITSCAIALLVTTVSNRSSREKQQHVDIKSNGDGTATITVHNPSKK